MLYTPQPGDIGLTQIRGDVGKAIRVLQRLNGTGNDDIEHAFMVTAVPKRPSHYAIGTPHYELPSARTYTTVVEAEPGGAVESSLSKYTTYDVLYIRCPDEYRQAVAAAAKTLIDTPYSYEDYLALTAHRLHIPVPGLKDYISDSGHMICSQLVDHAAMLGGWHLFTDGRWEGYVTPGHLTDYYYEQPYAERIKGL